MLNADLIFVTKEEEQRTLLGAERAATAIVLALHTVATEAHDTLFQLPLLLTDAAVIAYALLHGLEPLSSGETFATFLDRLT